MQDTLEALRKIPHVTAVHLLSEANQHPEIEFKALATIMSKKKRLSLIGKNGCAILYSTNASIVLVKSDANVNLGAIDFLLDSIE